MTYPNGRKVADKLAASLDKLNKAKAFTGFDGFIDELIRVVKSRKGENEFTTFAEISDFANVLALAAGKSADLEIIVQKQKLGGNAPIMASALASLGIDTLCCGALGYPKVHDAFGQLPKNCEAVTFCPQAHTYAFEFDDGKLMFANLAALNSLTWEKLIERLGEDYLIKQFAKSNLISLVNWSLPMGVQGIWEGLLKNVMSKLPQAKDRIIFFDLADPTKRTREDICNVLNTMGQFSAYGDTVVGLNENEALKVYAAVFGKQPTDLCKAGKDIQNFSGVNTVVIHPIDRAYVISDTSCEQMLGYLVEKPLLTTGGGDNFNAGFCIGLLAGLKANEAALCGMAVSRYYVENGASPNINCLIERLSS